MKLLTLEDYQKAGETFWPRYWYVAKELGEDAKAEDGIRDQPRSRGLGDVYKRQYQYLGQKVSPAF